MTTFLNAAPYIRTDLHRLTITALPSFPRPLPYDRSWPAVRMPMEPFPLFHS